MDDLAQLWTIPWFDRALRQHYGLDHRRHIRYDGRDRVLYYVVRRGRPPERMERRAGFAVDEKCLHWMLGVERHGQVDNAYVILVEDWKDPPQPVYSATVRALWDKLERIVPFTGSEGSSFWWLNDTGEPQDAWLGPVLRAPPF